MIGKMGNIEIVIYWIVKLIPAAALFSLFFTMEDSLRWLGLLGTLPLLLATQKGCPSCGPQNRSCDTRNKDEGGDRGYSWHPWPGH